MSESPAVVVLSGGTGGAKLARGMLDVVGPERLTVVANPGDDIEIYGGHVSPDPDLVSFWLADRIDPRGWGLDGDTFTVTETLRALGEEIWFNLGDQDLAIAIRRARALAEGRPLTEAHREINAALGVRAAVLPASDRPVRTRVLADGRWWTLQEFLIRARGRGEVQDVQFRGAAEAGISRAVRDAITAAAAIVIGPSNPIISIGPMLAIPQLRAALRVARAPVVAVSPIVGGEVLKGPTAAFMRHRGVEVSASGLATLYAGVIDGLVTDESTELPVPALRTELLMDGAAGRERLARATLEFATSLTRQTAPPSSVPPR
ncbi:MAG TPA: 2-phospho-L-lactate transferase [Solirubrobacteraceae bacterium]|nr:2-phospho-L-lactate transferase [Solirubrobacteraceae bacterium]